MMADDGKHHREPPGLPGRDVVGKFTDEVRGAVTDGITTGTQSARKSFAWWCIATIISCLVCSAAMTWLVVTWLVSTSSSASFVMHHADGTSEVCTRGSDSTASRPVLVCRLTVP